jgi:hypothetical protein
VRASKNRRVETAGEATDQASGAGKRTHLQHQAVPPARVLVVGQDDEFEQELRTLMGRLRLTNDVEAVFLHTVADAARALASTSVDVLMAQPVLPDGTSADLFRFAADASPGTRRVEIGPQGVGAFPPFQGGERWERAPGSSDLRHKMEHLLILHTLSRGPPRH